MKHYYHLLFVFLFLTIPSFAQKEAAIWYFGNNAGLDFNSGSPVALTNGKLVTKEGYASISDKNGIYFFTLTVESFTIKTMNLCLMGKVY
jgi:hypothetical protein